MYTMQLATVCSLAALLGGCAGSMSPPVGASARSVTTPVLVGKVRTIGGAPVDSGPSHGEVDVNIHNGDSSQSSHTSGSELVAVELLKQQNPCLKCGFQISEIEVFGRAGIGSKNEVTIEGDLREPPAKKGGAK